MSRRKSLTVAAMLDLASPAAPLPASDLNAAVVEAVAVLRALVLDRGVDARDRTEAARVLLEHVRATGSLSP